LSSFGRNVAILTEAGRIAVFVTFCFLISQPHALILTLHTLYNVLASAVIGGTDHMRLLRGLTGRPPSVAVTLGLICITCNANNSVTPSSPPLEISNPLQDRGFSVVSFSDPSFRTEVSQLLTPAALYKAKEFLPKSAVIINSTGQYIWGFTVIYTYPDRIAPAGTPWRHIISPKSRVADRSRMFAPGARYLITPVSDFLASRDASGKKSLQPFLDEGLDRIIDLFKRDQLTDRLQLSVDAVIFETGVTIGPDSAGMREQINLESQAQHELVESLKGLTGDELRNEILIYKSLDATSTYNRFRKNQAEFLLRVLDMRGEAELETAVENLRVQQRFIDSDMATKENLK
jgi:hypothetical protein